MKVIDLLNKIAKGEEDRLNYHRFSRYDYCTVDEFFARYTIDEVKLNLEIIEDKPKEDKKIEKIGKSYDIMIYSPEDDTYNYDLNKLIDMVQDIYEKQCEIIDKINGGN